MSLESNDELLAREIAQRAFARSIEVKRQALATLGPAIERAAARLAAAYRAGGKALFCGNGGSAADAQHLAAEFVGRYLLERKPLPAIALHANASALTAIGNDYGYEQSFARPLEAFAGPHDVLVAISTSGGAANVCEAARVARSRGLGTIALTGATGGRLRDHADILLNVPSDETPRIQECHILIGHILCETVERALAAPAPARRAVFLDRDGVLNRSVAHATGPGAPWRLEELELLPGVLEACRRLRAAGWLLVGVTNQPDVPRGHTTAAEVERVNRRLLEWLPLETIRTCLHDNADRCECRKPKPGLLTAAARDLDIDLSGSWMIGDRRKDIEAGRAAGCRTVLVGPEGDVAGLPEAVDIILGS